MSKYSLEDKIIQLEQELEKLKSEIESLKTAYNELFDDQSETVKDLRNDLEWALSNLLLRDHC